MRTTHRLVVFRLVWSVMLVTSARLLLSSLIERKIDGVQATVVSDNHETHGNHTEGRYIVSKTVLDQIHPQTDGWRSFITQKFRQIVAMESPGVRFDASLLVVGSGILQPNMTETGWALTRSPTALTDDLRRRLHEGIALLEQQGLQTEDDSKPFLLGYEDPSLAMNMGLLTDQERYPLRFYPLDATIAMSILEDLRGLHEEWVGRRLRPAAAYGFRLYQNQSTLFMHLDNANTHVVSSILHIDHSNDSKPWPLVLQDFHGNRVEVEMTTGDMVLYESAKVFHGRPRTFDGSWYSSLFLHYYPEDVEGVELDGKQYSWGRTADNMAKFRSFVIEHNIDRHKDGVRRSSDTNEPGGDSPLGLFGMALMEPECDDNWCHHGRTLQMNGPFRDNILQIAEDKFRPLHQYHYVSSKSPARSSDQEL